MANVTLDFTNEQLKEILERWKKDEDVIANDLERLRANIATVEGILNPDPWVTVQVRSDTDWARKYSVRRNKVTNTYACSCPSFQFASGVDSMGYCKHIRKAIMGGQFPGAPISVGR